MMAIVKKNLFMSNLTFLFHDILRSYFYLGSLGDPFFCD